MKLHAGVRNKAFLTILDSVLYKMYRTQKLRYATQNTAIGSQFFRGQKLGVCPYRFILEVLVHLHFFLKLPTLTQPLGGLTLTVFPK